MDTHPGSRDVAVTPEAFPLAPARCTLWSVRCGAPAKERQTRRSVGAQAVAAAVSQSGRRPVSRGGG